jgi:hypothetical protein
VSAPVAAGDDDDDHDDHADADADDRGSVGRR